MLASRRISNSKLWQDLYAANDRQLVLLSDVEGRRAAGSIGWMPDGRWTWEERAGFGDYVEYTEAIKGGQHLM